MLTTNILAEKKEGTVRHLSSLVYTVSYFYIIGLGQPCEMFFPLVTNVAVGFVCLCSDIFFSEQKYYTLNILVLNWFFHW